jgi:hypothetical protein
MEKDPLNPPPPQPLWWLIWGSITAAFFMVMGIFETGMAAPIDTPPALAFLALAPLAASSALRFVLLPRAEPAKTFIFFIVGLALAESGGFLALILGSPWQTALVAAVIVLIIVHIPAFIRRV